jgi:syntaxin 1B/2/3
MRAQQANVSTNSYPTQASREEHPYPYAQRDSRSYEMADVGNSKTHLASPSPPPGDMPAFYIEISSIQDTLRRFNDNVAQISDLHSRSLNNMDDAAAQRNAAQLDELVEDTSALSATLKKRIQALEAQKGSGRDGLIRQQQTALVKSKFVEAIQNYQTVEQQYRTKYKERQERQFKIVAPNATPEQVKAVVNNDEQGGQIFSRALLSSRYTNSREAYREVQERHQDIQRMEKTLGELAQLFNDMSVIVGEQDDAIKAITGEAGLVEQDTEAALEHTDKAVISARAARKKRWICFFILLIVLAVVGIIVGVLVSRAVANNKTK